MPRRLTDDLLIALVLGQVLSGVVGWALPIAIEWPLYEVHRALGVGLILLLGWKQAIVLRSLRRRLPKREPSILWSSIAGVGLLVTLSLGLAWTLNLISFDLFWGYSPMNIHVIVGIALVPFVGVHMLLRRKQNSGLVRSRRTLLRVGGLAAATAVGWQAIEHLAPQVRRPTGSKETLSLAGNAFPAEIWLFDGVPFIDASTWRLGVLNRELTLEDLSAYSRRDVRAVLDCTSGWWSEQVWSGVALTDVLHLPAGATGVAIVSVTGHRIVLPTEDVQTALLATHVGGEPISPGHGYPVRLVVPDRRGYHWVKWIARIDVA